MKYNSNYTVQGDKSLQYFSPNLHSYDLNSRYGPPTRTEYRLTVENLSSRISWQVRQPPTLSGPSSSHQPGSRTHGHRAGRSTNRGQWGTVQGTGHHLHPPLWTGSRSGNGYVKFPKLNWRSKAKIAIAEPQFGLTRHVVKRNRTTYHLQRSQHLRGR